MLNIIYKGDIMITHKLGTVKGRLEIKEVQEYVFESIPDPTDVKGTERMAYDRLSNLKSPCKVELYVTGLTMAVISVINAASALAVPITLMHYDRLVSHRSLAIFIHSGKTGIWWNMKKTKSDKGTQDPFSFEKYLNFPL